MFPINATKGKGHPSDLASVDCVTKVSDKFLKTQQAYEEMMSEKNFKLWRH